MTPGAGFQGDCPCVNQGSPVDARARPEVNLPAPALVLGAALSIHRWAACSASLFTPVPGQIHTLAWT